MLKGECRGEREKLCFRYAINEIEAGCFPHAGRNDVHLIVLIGEELDVADDSSSAVPYLAVVGAS